MHPDGLCAGRRLGKTDEGRAAALARRLSRVSGSDGERRRSQEQHWSRAQFRGDDRAGGKRRPQLLDGPYADSKEQLGGFHIIDVPDMDEATAWAARSPTSLHGVVEVRPIRDKTISEWLAEVTGAEPLKTKQRITEDKRE